MAEVNKTILIEYDVKTGKFIDENNKAYKSLKQLIDATKQVTAESEKMGDVEHKNTEIVIGSAKHLKARIAHLKEQREATSTTSDEYLAQTLVIQRLEKEYADMTKTSSQVVLKQKETAESTRELARLQENQSRAAGLAGAATFELGRTISDLPFGLVAISNNISQLGTLMTALVANAGSVREALKALKTQLLGPGGILVAFQIITAAVTFYAQRSKEANKETESFNERLSELNTEVVKLELLANIVNDNSASIKQQTAALKALKESGFDPATQSIDEFIEAQQKLAIARATAEMFAKDIARLEKERLDLLSESRDVLSDLVKAQEEVGGGPVDILKAQVETIRERLNEIKEESQASRNRLQELFKDISLVETVFGGKETETVIDGTINAIQKQISELEKQRDSTATTTDQVKGYNDQIKELKASLDELQTAKSRLSVEVDLVIEKQGKLSLKDLIDGPEKTEAEKWAEENLQESADVIVDEFQKRVKSAGKRDWFVDTFGVSKETINNTLDQVQRGLDATFGLITAQMDKEIALEKNKTTALNDQLRARLRNEQLTAEQRDKIQQQISNNEAELVKKQNEIEKKKFQLNKAQGIANAVVNTATAVTKVLPNIPLAGFIGALGAAQVAAITAQTFSPKPMPSPNLTALGSSESAGQSGPSFNVVGGTQFNQLASAIEVAMSKTPIRSYVVSSDVTTAQELERKIVEGASI